MYLSQIISQSEGRRLEFKAILLEKSDLAKTIVAFANDAGGELYIGIQNNPREAIRNAVVHRNYSLTGKDVKVAIYDDMVEITSPGLLPPFIDYDAMESRQSDARNKIIAPVFKRMGIIDQWGNGLKFIADELNDYPNIELRWREVGLSFQLPFVKSDYAEGQDYPDNTTPNKNEWEQVETKSGASLACSISLRNSPRH